MKPKSLIIFVLLFFSLFNLTSFAEDYIYISLTKDQGELPARFYIQDNKGRRTGYDYKLKKYFDDIPNALFDQEELSDDLNPNWFRIFYIFRTWDAYTSDYLITVTTREETPYDLCVEAGRKEDPSLFRVIYQDTIKPDEKKSYKLTYSTDPTIPLRVEEVESLPAITVIEQMIAYIHTAFSEGRISSKGIANGLIAKLEPAGKHLEKGKPKQAVNVLNAFLNELESQHEKHIAGEVYDYLKENVTALITRLGSPE
ncbi:MAG TPA: hypothetical protein ENN17_04615 [bacterium]|nr:hypothetical protein [bacterium]